MRGWNTYVYAYGYKSRDKAESALENMFAEGEVSLGEEPKIERRTVDQRTSWSIVLHAGDPF